jgi:hypothetical protein
MESFFVNGVMEMYRPLTMRALLEEILRRQEEGGRDLPMEGLRNAFPPGDAVGDAFILLLHQAVQEGLVTGVSFVYGGDGLPFEAVWDAARLTIAGRKYLAR